MTTQMRTPMTISEIERRLRFAAPDEPALLPELVLPVGTPGVRAAAVRMRGSAAPTRNPRLAYVLLALLLAAALAVAAGAVRLLDRQDPLATACDPMIAGVEGCLPVPVPAGWIDLGSGQFQSGEFAEAGLGYTFAQQIMASAPLGACATPGGPFPEAVPSGDVQVVEVPLPTPDAGLACLRAAPLPENGVRIVTFRGSRSLGGDAETGAIIDSSEPTAEAGWTETVGGRPARLTILPGTGERIAETRIWDVIWPGSVSVVLRIKADIAGPDVDAGRAKAQEVIDAVDFQWDVPPLDEGKKNDVLKAGLDQLDRSARESHSDLYSCFPREPGSRSATIRGSEGGPLAEPLAVTCSSSIEPSVAAVWRITLEVAWQAGEGYPADTLRTEYFSTGQSYGMGGIAIEGGLTTSVAGRTAAWDDPTFSWFPNTHYEPPAPLAQPLNLPAGPLARILWPGEDTASEPGGGEDSMYPNIVGTHVWVLDGPVVLGDDEWYRVQAGTSFAVDAGWIRGTRDGRPQLELVEAECPAADGITVGDLMWLIAAERLLCFEDREVTIEHGVMTFDDAYADSQCTGDDNVVRPCPTPEGASAWIAAVPGWSLYGAGGPYGPEPGLFVWLAPGVPPPVDGEAVRVKGHFDDPAAQACATFPTDGFAVPEGDHELLLLLCRERFVVTSIEPL